MYWHSYVLMVYVFRSSKPNESVKENGLQEARLNSDFITHCWWRVIKYVRTVSKSMLAMCECYS
jgi:hypothetical protein